MKDNATCFFCYSWDNDINDVFVYLKKRIERISGNTVTVMWDRNNYKYNDNQDEKIEELKKYDLIVPFFTPEFKALLNSDPVISNRVILKEYEIIKHRFKQDRNSILPVIYSGSIQTALPELFQRQICPYLGDINFCANSTRKTNSISQNQKQIIDKFLCDLIGLVKLNFNKRSNEYKSAKEALDKLFYLTNTTQLPNSCLIKMDAYEKIISQNFYFVVGRKGSGKSTFLTNLCKIDPEYFNNNYKKLTPICADNLNLDHIYKVISNHKVDKIEIPAKDLIAMYWEIFFVLLCVFVVGIEEEEGNIQDRRAKKFKAIANKLKELIGLQMPSGKYLSFRKDGVLKLLSTTAIEFIDDYFNIALRDANANNLLASFQGKFIATNILNEKIGAKLLEDFVLALEKCEKKIIISIDGFDKESEAFRRKTQYLSKTSNEYLERLDFETTFYGQLIEAASNFRYGIHNDPIQNVLQDYIDFCIVLPKDRYDQIVQLDRDSAKKQFCSLDWDEYELINLIICRLEYVIKKKHGGGYNFPESGSLKERFYNVLKIYDSSIPNCVYINIDGNNMRFDLFNYILRLSFWRPRDIISHFSSILPLFSELEDEEVQNELLKLTLKASAKKIIKDEFIKEYENVFLNLEEVLHLFDYQDLIMEPNKFIKIVSQKHFEATFSYDLDNTDNKLYVLYQLGVIGLYFDENSFRKYGYANRLCYIYNEGLDPIDMFIQRRNYSISNPKIIFNTIFIEYLSLNVNTKALIGDFDWTYIERMHKIKSAIRRI